ncbi:hypothetical protein FUAX_46330 (plasmid) [Fulvitalea axinellae]|uniref:Cadherin domain-containing protein n=1 Tax=Fulvitalea axinellae TaxID=1182444 RepID=A0AAU9CJB0_9BACT|nr:hypothetical protein FUAX_46330 [Fulvitalea axinellae]
MFLKLPRTVTLSVLLSLLTVLVSHTGGVAQNNTITFDDQGFTPDSNIDSNVSRGFNVVSNGVTFSFSSNSDKGNSPSSFFHYRVNTTSLGDTYPIPNGRKYVDAGSQPLAGGGTNPHDDKITITASSKIDLKSITFVNLYGTVYPYVVDIEAYKDGNKVAAISDISINVKEFVYPFTNPNFSEVDKIVITDSDDGPLSTYSSLGSLGFDDIVWAAGAGACTEPDVPTVTYNPQTVCAGSSTTLNITGNLNDATKWVIYSGSCGDPDSKVDETTNSTFQVTPSSPSTQYFVRGEGGCATSSSCGNVTVSVTPISNSSFAYGSSSYSVDGFDPTPSKNTSGGTFTATPSGLSINPNTGAIDVSLSTPKEYTVKYTTAGSCPSFTTKQVTVTPDVTAPAGYLATIDQAYVNSTNQSAISFTFANAEPGSTYEYTITSDGGGTPVTNNGVIATATDQITGINLSGLGDGTLKLTVTLTDAASNKGMPSIFLRTKDTVAPSGYSVSIDQDYFNNPVHSSLTYSFSGAEVGATYEISVTSDGAGSPVSNLTVPITSSSVTARGYPVDASLPDGNITLSFTVTDEAGNVGPTETSTKPKDTVKPTIQSVTIDPVNGNPPAKTATEIVYTLTFSEPVSNVSADDFTVFNTVSPSNSLGSITDITPVASSNGASYKVTVGISTGEGTVSLILNNGSSNITDAVTNPCAGPFSEMGVHTVDTVVPVVSIGTPIIRSGKPLANISDIIEFNLAITGATSHNLEKSDIELVGSLAGSVTSDKILLTGKTGSNPAVLLSGISGDGTIGIKIKAGAYTDASGDSNVATDPSGLVTIDNTPPKFSIGDPSVPVTNNGPVSYPITVDDNTVTLEEDDILVKSNDGVTATKALTGNATSGYTLTLTNIQGEGSVSIDVKYGAVTDVAGNQSVSASSGSVAVDKTPPSVAFGVTKIRSGKPKANSSDIIEFNINVTGADFYNFDKPDIELVGSLAGSVTPDKIILTSATGPNPVVLLSGITGDGTIGIKIKAGPYSDFVGNESLASPSSTLFTVDNTRPVFSIEAPSVSVTKNGPVSYPITVDDNAVTLEEDDILVKSNDGVTATKALTGNATSGYTLTLTNIQGDGNVSIDVIHAAVTDEAGNVSFSKSSAPVTADNTPPTVTLGTPTKTLVNNGKTVEIPVTISGADNIDFTKEKLSLTGPSSATVEIQNGTTASPTIKLTNFSGDGVLTVSVNGSVASDQVGNTSSGSTNSVQITVDNTPPTVVVKNKELFLNAAGLATLATSDIDNNSSDANGIEGITLSKTDYSCDALGPQNVTLTVTDKAGNSDNKTATVTVKDNIKPVVSVKNITVQLDANGQTTITANDIDNGSTDNCGIKSKSIDVSSFDCSHVGTPQTVTLTVTDNSDNQETGIATVTVEDNVKPALSAQDFMFSLDAAGNGTITVSDLQVVTSDACGAPEISLSKTAFVVGDIGDNTVTVTATDENGNTEQVTVNVKVQDTTDPELTAEDYTLQLNASGQGTLTKDLLNVVATDAAGIASVTLSKTDFNCDDIGSESVTVTATDNSGRTSTKTVTVTIEDKLKPVAKAKSITVQLDENGQATITADDIDNGSSDNCGISSKTIDVSSFDCSHVGTPQTVTLTVTDNYDQKDMAVAEVTVEDNVKPALSAQDFMFALDAAGNGTITVSDLQVVTSDACGAPEITLSKTAFVVGDIGDNTVTVTATDENGNTEQVTVNVKVQDTTDPELTAEDYTLQLNASGQGTLTKELLNVVATDAAGIASVTLSKTNFSCDDIGSESVTVTATDNSGRTSTETVTVTIEDKLKPIAKAKNITVQLDENGQATITADDIDNGSTDNCGISSKTIDVSSFDCSHVGTPQTVTLTVTDNYGQEDMATAEVTVEDNVKPALTAQNFTLQLDATGAGTITASDLQVSTTDICGVPEVSLSKTDFDCSNVGENSVTVTATDKNGNKEEVSVSVMVEDKVKPTLTAEDYTLELSNTGTAVLTAEMLQAEVTDACEIKEVTLSKSEFDCSNLGTNQVTVSVEDKNGNVSQKTVTVTVKDVTAPEVSTVGTLTVQLDESGNATITAEDIDASSEDACGIAERILDISTFDCSNIGTPVTVTLTAKDASGNQSTGTAVVTVEDNVKPALTAQNFTLQLDAIGAGTITASDLQVVTSDACGTPEVSLSKTDFDCSNAGENSVTVTATDENGNETDVAVTVTVEDEVAPEVVAQDFTLDLDATGNATLTKEMLNIQTADACGAVEVTLDKTSFDCSNVGENDLVITGTDIYGNKTDITIKVTVKDVTLPEVMTQDITVELDASGQVSITPEQINNNSADACGIGNLELDMSNFDCSKTGENTVTLTVTDNNGNSATGTAKVTVLDKIDPTIECPVKVDAQVHPSETTVEVTVPLPVLADNCSGVTVTNSFNNLENASGQYPRGVTEIVWTVTDASGNTATCTSEVSVTEIQLPPVISAIAVQNIDEGSELSFDVSAEDPNKDGVGFALSAEAIAAGLTLNGSTVTWTPNESQGPSSYTFTLTATDDSDQALSSTIDFTVNVGEVNEQHSLATLQDITLPEHEELAFTLQVSDVDLPRQPFVYSVDQAGQDLGFQVNASTGEVSWTPGEDHGGNTYTVEFTVVDGSTENFTASTSLKVTVTEVNDPVVIDTEQGFTQTLNVGEEPPTLSFKVTDPEAQNIETRVTVITSPKNVISEDDFEVIKDGDEYEVKLKTIDKEFIGVVDVTIIVEEIVVQSRGRQNRTSVREIDFEFKFEKREIPLDIPNMFTPNGDGVNDTWNIVYLGLYDSNTVQVYDQFGLKVFERRNYNRDDEWDGGDLESGPYFYVIKVSSGEVYKGKLTIIR